MLFTMFMYVCRKARLATAATRPGLHWPSARSMSSRSSRTCEAYLLFSSRCIAVAAARTSASPPALISSHTCSPSARSSGPARVGRVASRTSSAASGSSVAAAPAPPPGPRAAAPPEIPAGRARAARSGGPPPSPMGVLGRVQGCRCLGPSPQLPGPAPQAGLGWAGAPPLRVCVGDDATGRTGPEPTGVTSPPLQGGEVSSRWRPLWAERA